MVFEDSILLQWLKDVYDLVYGWEGRLKIDQNWGFDPRIKQYLKGLGATWVKALLQS